MFQAMGQKYVRINKSGNNYTALGSTFYGIITNTSNYAADLRMPQGNAAVEEYLLLTEAALNVGDDFALLADVISPSAKQGAYFTINANKTTNLAHNRFNARLKVNRYTLISHHPD